MSAPLCWVRTRMLPSAWRVSASISQRSPKPTHNSLVLVGRLPQLVRSHSPREVVVLHDVLEVKIWHQLKLEEQRGVKRLPWATWPNVRGGSHIYLHHRKLCRGLWRSWWSLDIPACCRWRLPVVKQERACITSAFTPGGALSPHSQKATCQNDLTFSFAAFLVSESIQLTCWRLSSNAHLIFVTMSSTWGTQRGRCPHQAWSHIWLSWRVHSPRPCCPQQRCLWRTWLRRQSPRRCPCRWHTASSGACSSATHTQAGQDSSSGAQLVFSCSPHQIPRV